MLSLVGLGDKHDSYPSNLSGGQKQRVAIARALASNPKVLLCDEATSALDPATTRSILELLKDINRRLGLTILLITHEMDVVKRICDCVAVISNGELIEQDTVSEVFSHPKTPLAQKFIQSTLHLDIPEDYQERLQAEPFTDCVPMLRLEFTGQSVDAPLLSETARRFNVNNNIISAQMDYAGGVKFGIMLTEMHGTQQDTQAAIAWLQADPRELRLDVVDGLVLTRGAGSAAGERIGCELLHMRGEIAGIDRVMEGVIAGSRRRRGRSLRGGDGGVLAARRARAQGDQDEWEQGRAHRGTPIGHPAILAMPAHRRHVQAVNPGAAWPSCRDARWRR